MGVGGTRKKQSERARERERERVGWGESWVGRETEGEEEAELDGNCMYSYEFSSDSRGGRRRRRRRRRSSEDGK